MGFFKFAVNLMISSILLLISFGLIGVSELKLGVVFVV